MGVEIGNIKTNRLDCSFSFSGLFKYISGKMTVEKNPEKWDINTKNLKEGTKMSSK